MKLAVWPNTSSHSALTGPSRTAIAGELSPLQPLHGLLKSLFNGLRNHDGMFAGILAANESTQKSCRLSQGGVSSGKVLGAGWGRGGSGRTRPPAYPLISPEHEAGNWKPFSGAEWVYGFTGTSQVLDPVSLSHNSRCRKRARTSSLRSSTRTRRTRSNPAPSGQTRVSKP